MKLDPEVIQDLLPLYLAGEASPATRRLVDEHLAADPELARLARAAADPEVPDLLRHLLLEVRRHRHRARRPALEDRGQPARSALPRPALPARHRRHRRPLRPDRLRTPLLRTHERGEDKWNEVTWDEALDYIAGEA
jgi:anti-sigma factor RsiW